MSNSGPLSGAHSMPHLPVRGRRVVSNDGDELLGTTVFCPIQERSMAVATCEKCERFHALHFDAVSRTTSVACHCESAAEGARPDAAGGKPDPNTPLAEIMTRTVICVRSDTTLEVVLDLMVRNSIGGMPVVDDRGHAVGIVSRSDILRAQHEDADMEEMRRVTARPKDLARTVVEPGSHVMEPTALTAGDVMSPVVLALHESSNIGQGASLMAFEGVHRLPVLADGGEVVGILSALDVMRWFGRRSGYFIPGGRRHE